MLKLCDILDEKEKVLHEVSTEATFPLDKKYFELIDEAYNYLRLSQDDEKAKEKDRTYSEFPDAAVFTKLDVKEDGGNLVVTANYKLGNLDKAQWTINPSGELALDYTYNFSGVVDLMGICFDYPEDQVISKRWLGAGPYRVWQNRIHGTQYDVWENDYNDPIPGETFTYPEFKGYFADVSWMNIQTKEGTINLTNETPDASEYISLVMAATVCFILFPKAESLS